MPIELSGMDELLARLANTTQSVERTKEKALKKGAEVIKEEMITNAPVLTGNLKENIEVSDMKTKNSTEYVEVGPNKDAFYAKFIEFGTIKQKAKPFIEPAFLAKRREALDIISDVIKEAINDV